MSGVLLWLYIPELMCLIIFSVFERGIARRIFEKLWSRYGMKGCLGLPDDISHEKNYNASIIYIVKRVNILSDLAHEK